MLQTIRIQNFRSLEDVTLTLQEVNLLIGPNNSGKSNLFKALEFLGKIWRRESITEEELTKMTFLKEKNITKSSPISFTIIEKKGNDPFPQVEIYRLEIYGYEGSEIVANEFIGKLRKGDKNANIDLNNIPQLIEKFANFKLLNSSNWRFEQFSEGLGSEIINELIISENTAFLIRKIGDSIKEISSSFELGEIVKSSQGIVSHSLIKTYNWLIDSKIYAVNISNLKIPYPTLEDDFSVNGDASNLVAYFDNMRDAYPEVMVKMNKQLKECITEFETIIFEKVSLPKNHISRKIHGDKTFKIVGILDKYMQKYWADELSDGTLYFLALLGIIHQPNPPKLILLEEPENGIHPRRIKEIVDFIFDLAESKGIQVIMTTHSTVLIDEFKDLPESIFVFDKPGESTIIKNLQTDIIDVDSEQSKKLNLPQIDLSGSLGEHWASGLIGGVPI